MKYLQWEGEDIVIGTADKYSHSFPSGLREVLHFSGLCEVVAMQLV